MIASSLYCPRLIGRQTELSALLEAATRAGAGQGSVVLVAGEAGSGKTRLLAEFCSWAARRNTVVTATCYSFAPSPLGPIEAILESLDATFQKPEPGTFETSAADRALLFRRIRESLAASSAKRTVVMVVDDVHWADAATVDLMQYVADRIGESNLLLVAAYRPEDIERAPAAAQGLSRLARLPVASRVALGALSDIEIQELIEGALADRAPLPRATIREIGQRSEGNPLFAEELAKSTVDGTGDAATFETSLRGLFAQRLARLDPSQLRLLETAALIGRRFDITFLEHIAESTTHAQTLAFLRVAVAEHFIIEDRADPGWFAFRHALVRDAILAPILAVEARATHARIARELERRPDAADRVTEISDHYWMADAKADCAPYALRAGNLAASRHAYAAAAEQFERIFAYGIDDLDARGRLHRECATTYLILGEVQRAAAHFQASAAAYESAGSLDLANETLLGEALCWQRMGDATKAYAVMDGPLSYARSAATDGAVRFKIFTYAGLLRLASGDNENIADYLDEAQRFEAHARPRDLGQYHFGRVRSLSLDNAPASVWEPHAEVALAKADAASSPDLALSYMTLFASLWSEAGDAVRATEIFERAVATGAGLDVRYMSAHVRLSYTKQLMLVGRLKDAREQLGFVIASAQEALSLTAWLAERVARLSILLRDDDLYRRVNPPAILERVFEVSDVHPKTRLASAVAEKLAADGDLDGAVALLARALAIVPDLDISCEVLLPAAVYATGAAELDLVRTMTAKWRSCASPYMRAHYALIEAYLAARFEAKKTAVPLASAAAEQFAQLGMPLLEAEAYALAGDKARAVLLMESTGARALERRLPVSTATAVSRAKPLTAREREIASLASRGLSNKAMAERLSLSERTVESHLASAFGKLGVTSRQELATAIAEQL